MNPGRDEEVLLIAGRSALSWDVSESDDDLRKSEESSVVTDGLEILIGTME